MFTKDELRRLEQSKLIELIDDGLLIMLPCKEGTPICIKTHEFGCIVNVFTHYNITKHIGMKLGTDFELL